MLNPINHTRTAADVERYKVEPYVTAGRRVRPPGARRAAAAGPGTPGRPGGCTAPGSRAFSASRGDGSTFELDPCIPAAWPGYSITWRFGRTRYEITVSNPQHHCRGIAGACTTASPCDAAAIPLVDDGATHRVDLVMGERRPGTPTVQRKRVARA